MVFCMSLFCLGIPIGVVEVKAPGDGVMQNRNHFGQLFDNVMQKREYDVIMFRVYLAKRTLRARVMLSASGF